MSDRKLALCVLGYAGALAVAGPQAVGDLITFEFAGEVTSIYDPEGLIGDAVTLGSPLSGLYTFESTTPDTRPSQSSRGLYDGAITHLAGHVGAMDFSMAPDSSNEVDVWNGLTSEAYQVDRGIQMAGRAPGFQLNLAQSSGSAFEDDSLPLSPPDLSLFDSTRFLISTGTEGYGFSLSGELTSLVPEPSTLALLALGAWATLRRRRPKGYIMCSDRRDTRRSSTK